MNKEAGTKNTVYSEQDQGRGKEKSYIYLRETPTLDLGQPGRQGKKDNLLLSYATNNTDRGFRV